MSSAVTINALIAAGMMWQAAGLYVSCAGSAAETFVLQNVGTETRSGVTIHSRAYGTDGNRSSLLFY